MSEGIGFTRRRLLAGAAGLGAAVLFERGIAGALSGGTRQRPADPPRVAIVGAGLAGLTCAYRLHQRGIPSTLYEAHPHRVGGRCWTARGFAASQTAEHGGEFIDTVQHRIRALAAELGLTLDDLEAAERRTPRLHPRLFLDGRERRFDAVYRDQHLIAARARADAHRIGSFRWNRAGRAARELDEMSAAEWLDGALPDPSQHLLRLVTAQFMAEEYGLDIGRLSAIAMLIEFAVGPESDERFHVRGGNDQIAWGLAERLPSGALRLDHPLTALRRRGSSFALSFAGVRGEARADVVVLCLPFTALRRVELDGAGLGTRKRRCIEELGMGTNAKLLIQFRRHLGHYDRFDGEYTDEAIDTWDSSLAERGRPGLLTVFSGGSYGARQRGRVPHGPAPRPRVDAALARVTRAVPGLAAGFDGAKTWLDHWTSDPWTHGSYAAFEPGQYTRYWGFIGRPEGRILFGGEHTALPAQGFLEGAVASGERCAAEVAALA
ncbi:MAG TPA: FAD-dependent oxidoreductase [Solirubrobacterales bacterium]|nr:FAD-dependent oxidoreductase [Solirubrobacterales bacterium]